MAHLEVEPKPSRPLWLWALIALLVILLAGMLVKNCNDQNPQSSADSIPADARNN